MMVRGISHRVWALRSAVAVGPVVAVLAPALQGYPPSAFVVLAVFLASLGWSVAPEHVMGGVAMIVVVVWWTTVVGEALPFASVVAAAGLVLSHSAATVLGYGPPRTEIAPRLVMTWARRAAMVWLAALVIWLVADVYSGHATPTSFWLLGLAGALIAALVAAFWLPVRDRSRS